jgi:diguanylate cyclase (GGDEF)-like protein
MALSSPSTERPAGVISLRMQMALTLAAMVFVVAGILGGLIGQNSALQLRARIGQSLQSDAARIAEQLNKEMAARARELHLLGTLDPLSSLKDARQVQALLEGLRHSVPAYLWLGLTDPQGRLIVGTAADPALLQGNGAANGAEPPPMILSHPVLGANNVVVGVIVAQLGWGWVRDLAHDMLEQDGNGASRDFYLLSNRDAVLLAPSGHEKPGDPLSLPATARARAGDAGWSVENWPDSHSYLTGAGYAAGEGPHPGPGSVPMQWVVLVREDVGLAFAPAAELRNQIILAGLVLAALLAVVGWVIAGAITAPLRRIARAADSLAQGAEIELPQVGRPSEIRILSESLRAMVVALTRKQTALDNMQTIAHHDPLTGLLNRNGLQAWYRARLQDEDLRDSGSLLIFLTDLDGFKQVNDRFGHPAGDAVLRDVARRMQLWQRPRDAVARLGGDEFVLVLDAPDGPGDVAAESVAHDIFTEVAGTYDVGNGSTARVGISLGGALWPEDDSKIERVMAKADAALYEAKRAGKNRIVMHQEQAVS